MKSIIFSLCLSFFPVFCLAKEIPLIGKGILTYSWLNIKVYDIEFFKEGNHKKMKLSYRLGVAGKHSKEGWKIGLKHILKKGPVFSKKVDWILGTVQDLKKKDQLTIDVKNDLVTISKNGDQIAQIKDVEISSFILDPWIGPSPVDKKLKKKLLGKN